MKTLLSVGALSLLVACTSPNPHFVGVDDGAVTPDLVTTDAYRPGVDGPVGRLDGQLPAEDLLPGVDAGPIADGPLPPDLEPPPPDGPPPACFKDEDCADGLLCTTDKCSVGACENSLSAGFCLIDGACVVDNDDHPTMPCWRCDATNNPSDWVPVPDNTACVDDKLACTSDVCQGGTCIHPMVPGFCLVGGVCVPGGKKDAAGCMVCEPGSATGDWSPVPDGSKCAVDGKPCTEDVCLGGKCAHPVVEGCLIKGVCVGEGTPGGQCTECVPDVSTIDFTFVAGKPCASSQLKLGAFCAASKCRTFTETTVVASGSDYVDSGLAAVSLVPGGPGTKPQVWAAGRYGKLTDGGEIIDGGLLVRLDKAGAVLTKSPLHALHHRMALAESGEVFQYVSNTWNVAGQLTSQFAGIRLAVWGASLGNQLDVHYFVGYAEPPESLGVYRCETLLGVSTCASNYVGFTDGAELAGVYGSVANGAQGPVWAITGSGPEDIYFNDGASKGWSQGVAAGCQDLGNNTSTPCSLTNGDFNDIYASSASDVWVVGPTDIALGYDGAAWTRHWGTAQFGAHTMEVVYSSPADHLVSFIGYRQNNSGRWIAMFNYNRKLDRWFGPVNIKFFAAPNYSSESRIADAAGSSYADLWLVGQAEPTLSAGDAKTEGWVLHLQ